MAGSRPPRVGSLDIDSGRSDIRDAVASQLRQDTKRGSACAARGYMHTLGAYEHDFQHKAELGVACRAVVAPVPAGQVVPLSIAASMSRIGLLGF